MLDPDQARARGGAIAKRARAYPWKEGDDVVLACGDAVVHKRLNGVGLLIVDVYLPRLLLVTDLAIRIATTRARLGLVATLNVSLACEATPRVFVKPMRGFAEEEEKTHRLGQPLPQLGDGRCSLPSHLCHVSLNATPREQHLVRLGTTRKVARCARESAQGVREPRRTPPGAAKTAPLTAAPTRTPPTHALGLRPSGTCRDYKPTRIVRRVSVAFGLLLLSPQTDLAAGDAGILRARAEARLKGGEERPSCARRALHCQGRVYAGLTRSVVYPRRLPLGPSRLGR